MSLYFEEKDIVARLRDFAHWTSARKIYLHLVLGGSSSIMLQTNGLRAFVPDMDGHIASVTSVIDGKIQAFTHPFITPISLLGDFTRACQSGSLRFDTGYADFVRQCPGVAQPETPYCSIRNKEGCGVFVSLVSLEKIADRKREYIRGYYASTPARDIRPPEKIERDERDVRLIGLALKNGEAPAARGACRISKRPVAYQRHAL